MLLANLIKLILDSQPSKLIICIATINFYKKRFLFAK